MSAPDFSDIERIEGKAADLENTSPSVVDMLGIIARELRITNVFNARAVEISAAMLAHIQARDAAQKPADDEVVAFNREVAARQREAWKRADEMDAEYAKERAERAARAAVKP